MKYMWIKGLGNMAIKVAFVKVQNSHYYCVICFLSITIFKDQIQREEKPYFSKESSIIKI